VPYGAETWTITKKEEQALLIFERQIFIRICGPKSPDDPARNKSLYRLHYPGPSFGGIALIIRRRDVVLTLLTVREPIPVSAQSETWICYPSLAAVAGSNPAGGGMDVCCESCVFLGRGLWVGPIIRSGGHYRVLCVWVWSWSLDNEEAVAH
jgi:hypothetical protein